MVSRIETGLTKFAFFLSREQWMGNFYFLKLDKLLYFFLVSQHYATWYKKNKRKTEHWFSPFLCWIYFPSDLLIRKWKKKKTHIKQRNQWEINFPWFFFSSRYWNPEKSNLRKEIQMKRIIVKRAEAYGFFIKRSIKNMRSFFSPFSFQTLCALSIVGKIFK